MTSLSFFKDLNLLSQEVVKVGREEFGTFSYGPFLDDLSAYTLDQWSCDGLIHGFLDKCLDVSETRVHSRAAYGGGVFFLPHQVHGVNILLVADSSSEAADGWYIDRDLADRIRRSQKKAGDPASLIGFGVRTADCCPLILAAKDASAGLVLHSGWKGTLLGIVGEAKRVLLAKGHSPEDFLAVLGPSAQVCCYEVKQDFIELLERSLRPMESWLKKDISVALPILTSADGGKFYFSLSNLLDIQLQFHGFSPTLIYKSSVCTICSENCCSHRREPKNSSRQLSFLAYKPN